MKIALAQINTINGNIENNKKKIIENIKKAKTKKCKLIIFPEKSLTGPYPKDLLLYKQFIKETNEALEEITKQCQKSQITCLIGTTNKNNDSIIKLINPNKTTKTFYSHNKIKENTFKINKTKFSVVFENNRNNNELNKNIIVFNSNPYVYNQNKEENQQFKNKTVLEIKSVGCHDQIIFEGKSSIRQNNNIIEAKQFAEDFIICNTQNKTKTKHSYTQKETNYEEIYNALVYATKEYLNKNNVTKIWLGLSGGIDSALVLMIANDAIGKENIHCLSMPSDFSTEGTRNDAKTLAENIGCSFEEIPIKNLYKQYVDLLDFENTPFSVAEENIQARIRGHLLMAKSNKYGGMVLATGNKSEASCGYFTMAGGDSAGSYSPLIDLWKTQVFEITKWKNSQTKLVPESLIERPPSAELRPEQKDSDSLPDYETLDSILKMFIEQRKDLQQIVKAGYDKKEVLKTIKLLFGSEFKRRQYPLGPKISSSSFSDDYNMMITQKFSFEK